MMTESAMIDALMSLGDVETQTVSGNSFFFVGAERMLPFATLMTNDENDTVSDLNRAGVYRLNLGVSKGTFQALFGSRPMPAPAEEQVPEGYDFTALDRVMPHPVYGLMHWVCVLSPREATFEAEVRPLLTEAHEMATGRGARREARRQG
jgi:hypothetical protein